MNAVALRPRGVVELLDLTVVVYRAAWRQVLTASALLILPLFALDSVVAVRGSESLGLGYVGLWIVRVVMGMFHNMLCQGIVALLVADLVAGRVPDLAPALRGTFRRAGRIVLATCLYTCIVVPGMMLLIIPGLVIAAALFAFPAAIVLEDATAMQSLSRSSTLTTDQLGRCLAALTVVFVTQIAIGAGGGLLIGWAIDAGMLRAMWLNPLTNVISIVTSTLASVVGALLYFDLRVRREGLDLELDMAALVPAPAATPAS